MSHDAREIIQISLGPSANSITAHSLNLQGLAATSNDEEQHHCDPQTTHSVRNNHWVPRALCVDESTRLHFASSSSQATAIQHNNLNSSSVWNGVIEPLDASLTIQHEQRPALKNGHVQRPRTPQQKESDALTTVISTCPTRATGWGELDSMCQPHP